MQTLCLWLKEHLSTGSEETPEVDPGYKERNLCAAYADHDSCPCREINENGVLTFCNCSCHLDPDALP